MAQCPHCGMHHTTTCPRIKSIEYGQLGEIRRVEFHPPFQVAPEVQTIVIPYGQPSTRG